MNNMIFNNNILNKSNNHCVKLPIGLNLSKPGIYFDLLCLATRSSSRIWCVRRSSLLREGQRHSNEAMIGRDTQSRSMHTQTTQLISGAQLLEIVAHNFALVHISWRLLSFRGRIVRCGHEIGHEHEIGDVLDFRVRLEIELVPELDCVRRYGEPFFLSRRHE